MEFLLNLLLLRGKVLTTAAAETLHEYIKKCMHFKRKISTEYSNATQIIPFENMLEFINNSSKYTCEGDVVTNDLRYLYEHINRVKQENEKHTHTVALVPQTVDKKLEELPKNQNLNTVPEWLRREHTKINEFKVKSQEHIIDNLHAILKSQEFLFKNIIKLVNILEKDALINSNSEKLDKIKRKLVACTDILSNAATSQQFTSLINKIIEEEITRCRFRHGESKTSAEINLKVPKPEGIEAALDMSHKNNDIRRMKKQLAEKIAKPSVQNKQNERLRGRIIDLEVKTNSAKLLKRARSEPVLNENRKLETIWKKTQIEIEESKKVIQVNEDRFKKFENTLWHTLTTMKFLSLKSDYANMTKCAFYNKRQFVATEATISKKVQGEEKFGKFVKISNSMFHITEKRLSFEEGQLDGVGDSGGANNKKTEVSKDKIFPKKSVSNAPPVLIQNQKKDEQGNNTIINGNDIKKLVQNHSANATVAVVVEGGDKSVIKSREIVPTERDNKQTNTIISVHNFIKKTADVSKNVSPLDAIKKDDQKTILQKEGKSDALNPIITEDERKTTPQKNPQKTEEHQIVNEPKIAVPEKIERMNQQTTDQRFVQSLRNSDLNKKPCKTTRNVKMRLNVILKTKDSLGSKRTTAPPPLIKSSKKESLVNNVGANTKLQTIASDNLKLCTLNAVCPKKAKNGSKKVSMHEFKSEADLIRMNNKAFQELETTIKTVQIVKPNGKTQNVKKQEKKSVSSENLASIMKQRNDIKREMKSEASSRAGGDEKISRKNKRDLHTEVKQLPKEKCKTFLKTSRIKSFVKPNPSNQQMRRTTKNAMKRQQVLTILPKVAKEIKEKKKPQVRLVEPGEIKTVKMKDSYCVSKKSSYVKFSKKILPNKKINQTSWEEEDGYKVASVVED
ncbi:uncharacterized protein LOC103312779 [Tribolium castaneum]|uniref:uncharacterized protein LOC103312779 n=1 Tax=Tribolium castaneum TaxID=7070 RepID=UPI0030FE9472